MQADPDLIASLRPVRLPSGFEAFSWPVVCAAFSLGIAIALLLILALRLVTDRRESRLTLARRDLMAASRLPDGERLFAQAALLDRLTAERNAERGLAGNALRETIGEQLYRPGARPDFSAIDAAILKIAAERRIGRNRPALGSRRRVARAKGDNAGRQSPPATSRLGQAGQPTARDRWRGA